jgi:hypothetical protein
MFRLHFESFFGLNRETDRDIGRSVEYFDQLFTEQATKLALGARTRGELDPAITGVAAGTRNIRFFHFEDMSGGRVVFQPGAKHEMFSITARLNAAALHDG